jgi:hypothetical protein
VSILAASDTDHDPIPIVRIRNSGRDDASAKKISPTPSNGQIENINAKQIMNRTKLKKKNKF